MQQVKGSVLKSRLAFIEEHGGADAVQRVLSTLSIDHQQALKVVVGVGWYPFELGKALDAAIVQVLGDGRTDFFERLGEASAERNLTGAHRSFLAAGDPHTLLERAPQIYAAYYETGRREYEQTGEKEGVLTTYDAETFSAPDCLTVVSWYRKALEMCGCTGVKVVEEECRAQGAEVCRYHVSWT